MTVSRQIQHRAADPSSFSTARIVRDRCGSRGSPHPTGWVLGQFAKTASVARRRYTEFVRSGLGLSSPWEHLRGQVLLGAPGFVEQLKPYLTGRRRLKDIPRAQRLLDRPSLEALFREDQTPRKSQRNQRIRQAHLQYAYTLSDIARYQGLHYTTVSKIVNEREN
ncbi:MAG: hypothetical protein ACREVJ_08755 [Gammaproteobacteria bacterium]